MKSPFVTRVIDYGLRHKTLLLVLAVLGLSALATGRWYAVAGSVGQGLWFSFGTGVLSSLVIAVVTDFMGKEFFYDILRNFETSMHEGGLMHSSHREILSRPETIERFFAEGQTAKIITLTADNYVNDDSVLDLLRQRIHKGSKVRILLHTPIYNLRSHVDKVRDQSLHGKRHLTALELVRQQTLLIPKIEEIAREMGDSFEVRFFAIQLHMHSAIWGNRRIFASPILRGVDGADSPCIEVFPGLRDAQLFSKFEKDFDYVWERQDLTFSVNDLKPIYGRVLAKYPLQVDINEIDPAFVSEIEAAAAALQHKFASVKDAHTTPNE